MDSVESYFVQVDIVAEDGNQNADYNWCTCVKYFGANFFEVVQKPW